MADWTRRVRTTEHVEYLVPFGYVGELYKTLTAAWNDFCGIQVPRKDPQGFMNDDWAKFSTDDENLIISFETTKTQERQW